MLSLDFFGYLTSNNEYFGLSTIMYEKSTKRCKFILPIVLEEIHQTVQNVNAVIKKATHFEIKTDEETFVADKLLIAAGSNPKIWELAKTLGHTIVEPVPSLFTFNINDKRIKEIPGISVPNATVKIVKTKLESSGPLLITHWGLSGPAVLKLSAFGARILARNSNIANQDAEKHGPTQNIILRQMVLFSASDSQY